MRITKRQLKKIIKEYSEHPSHADVSDTLEDMMEVMDGLMIKYVDSDWLAQQDQASLAKDLEKLFEDLNQLNNTFSAIAGRGTGR